MPVTEQQIDDAISRLSAPDETDPAQWVWMKVYPSSVKMGDIIRVWADVRPLRVVKIRIARRDGVLRFTLRLEPVAGGAPIQRTLGQVDQVRLRLAELAQVWAWDADTPAVPTSAVPEGALTVDTHGRLVRFTEYGPAYVWPKSSDRGPPDGFRWRIFERMRERSDVELAYRALFAGRTLTNIGGFARNDINVHRYGCGEHCGPGPRFIVELRNCPAKPELGQRGSERVVPSCYNLRQFVRKYLELQDQGITGPDLGMRMCGYRPPVTEENE